MTRSAAFGLALGALLSVACTAEDQNFAGMETSACLDGACFGDLQCLSDVCVAGDSDAGTDGPPSTTGPSTATGPSGGPSGTSGGTTNGDPTPGTTGSPSTSSSGTTDTTGLDSDTLPDPTVGTGPSDCGEVDVLFVVDHSGSMLGKQGRLEAAAPAFVDELAIRTGSTNPHIMVVDVDAWLFEQCELLCGFGMECGEAYVCGETMPLECEDTLGAGVVHPRGSDAANEDCGFTSGGRFIDGSQPNPDQTLRCALQVGTGGTGTELTGLAMAEAIDTMGDAVGCNAGFLREDALLVIVFVTDEDDGPEDSPGVPAGWHSRIVAAKGGNADQIFVLGLFGDNDQPNPLCEHLDIDPDDGAEPSERLEQFVEAFGGRGVQGSVCAEDYGPSFDALLNTVETACE